MKTDMTPEGDVLNLPIRRDTCFSNHKNEFKEAIMKKQMKILTNFSSFLKSILEPGEEILLAVKANSPMSFVEQWTGGWAVYFVKRSVLIFTNERVLHFPTTSHYSPKHSVSQIRYGDIEKLKLSGFLGRVFQIKYKIGRSEKFYYIKSAEFKKLKTLQSLMEESHSPSQALGRHFLCPRCTTALQKDIYSCPNCRLEFKNPKEAIKLSLILPGGGYFYTGHPFLGVLDAITEGILLISLIGHLLSLLEGAGSWGGLLLVGIILLFEKSVTVYHAKHFLKEYIPADKNFLIGSSRPAREPSSLRVHPSR